MTTDRKLSCLLTLKKAGHARAFFQAALAAGVTFQLPAGGTSGQAQGHRPKNRYGAPTQGPAFTGIPLLTSLLLSSSRLPCSPSSLLLYFPKASPLPYLLTVAVLREFFPFFGQPPGDFRRAVISAVTEDTCTASYLPEGGHGHYFYGP